MEPGASDTAYCLPAYSSEAASGSVSDGEASMRRMASTWSGGRLALKSAGSPSATMPSKAMAYSTPTKVRSRTFKVKPAVSGWPPRALRRGTACGEPRRASAGVARASVVMHSRPLPASTP